VAVRRVSRKAILLPQGKAAGKRSHLAWWSAIVLSGDAGGR
jgi:hypothetical protein